MKKFDNELAAIQKELSEMADLARSMVYLTAAAVKDRTRDVQTGNLRLRGPAEQDADADRS